MKIIKILAITFFVLLIVVGVGLAFFVATFDANHYKQQIITVVKKQTGRDLTINGDLKLSVFPDIAVKLGNTSLSNADGFTGNQFATIGSAAVSIKVMPLLKKEVKVDTVKLHGLKLNLHRKADGSDNWSDLAKGKEQEKQAKEDKAPPKVVQDMLENLSINGISIKQAQIHWKDDTSGQDITLSPANLSTGSFTPGKPLPVDLSLVMKLKNPSTTIAADGNTMVTFDADNQHFTLAALKLNSKITGKNIPNGALDVQLSGNVKGSPKRIIVPDLKLNAALSGDLIPQGEANVDLSGNLDLDIDKQLVQIPDLKLNTKVSNLPSVGGNMQALVTGKTRFNLGTQIVSIPDLVINAKLTNGPVKDGTATLKITGKTHYDLAKGHLKLPRITMNTQVSGGPVPGGSLTQQALGTADLNLTSKQGSVDLSSLQVNLADLELQGSQIKILPLADVPGLTGYFQSKTFNMKKVLKTLGIDPPVTSKATALSQVKAQFNLKADAKQANLEQLVIKLDKTSLTGKLAIKDFSAPGIRPELVIDSINIDDYLPPAAEEASTSPAKKSSGNEVLLPLDTLRALDINGGIRIGSMIINKLSLANVNTRINAKQGLIKIDPANASLYKGKYKGRITLDARQAVPTMKMQHELIGIRSEGLLFDLFQDKYISGDTKLVVDFSSRGNTVNQLLNNLNGTTKIAFKDGTIRDSKLAEKTALAIKVFEKKEVKDDKSVVTFTGLSGDWKINKGVFNTSNLSMLSPYLNVTGTGIADVAKQTLDMRLRIGSTSTTGSDKYYAPLRIYGSFLDPKFKLELKDLIKAMAQQDLDKAKQDIKDKLKLAEQEAKLKLDNEKKALQNKLAAEEKALKNKLAAEQKTLQNKLAAEKAAALKKLNSSASDKLKQQSGDGKNDNNGAKSLEDKAKDKLKDKLKGLF